MFGGIDTLVDRTGIGALVGTAGHGPHVRLNGHDRIGGAGGPDALYGDSGADRLYGGGGRDWLDGGLGQDLLVGGWGPDLFVFDRPQDSPSPAKYRDHIRGFEQHLDVVDLRAIDARPDQAGNQAFAWLGASGFTGSGGEVRFWQGNGATVILADIDGDVRPDFVVQLESLFGLNKTDFLL